MVISANVMLMMPPESDNTDAGGVFYRPRKLTNGLTGVNPVRPGLRKRHRNPLKQGLIRSNKDIFRSFC